jgi:hypothetical protein
MKTTWCCLLLALTAASGCVELPQLWDNPKAQTPVAAKPATPPLPVSVDQVTETNAYEKAEALRQELERDAQPPVPMADKPAPAKALP